MNIEVKIRSLNNQNRLRALVSVTLDGLIAIHEIKVIQGDERLFVAMPSRRNGNGGYWDIAHPISPEARMLVENAVLTEYHKFLAAQPQLVSKTDAIQELKAITIYQPWATLLALELKRYETRSWKTSYRGPIAIHAGRKPFSQIQAPDPVAQELKRHFPWGMDKLPLGFVIATAELVGCHLIDEAFLQTLTETERLLGDYTPGRYAWEFAGMKEIEHIPARGYQGLWNWAAPNSSPPDA